MGTWDVETSCFRLAPQSCTTATWSDDVNFTGTVTIGDDMRYTMQLASTGVITYHLPPECLTVTPNCPALEFGRDYVTCTGDVFPNGCTCVVDRNRPSVVEAGIWSYSSTLENGLNLSAQIGNFRQMEYCVQGNYAGLRSVSPDNDPITEFVLSR